MAAVALHAMTTAELLDELELRLSAVRTGGNGSAPSPTVHCSFSAAGECVTAPDILRVRMELAGLTKTSLSTVFGVPPDRLEEWLSGSVPEPAWVVPAIRLFEMLPASARQKVLRTTAARPGKRTGNMHPFACIEEL